ncbi:hypothetical protein [Streptomyces harbinensis]|uniref:hypothetical protein n=1 Tax=Streptomyces harbinensis TaxID=1176198 RepID=UPI0036A91BEE
MRVRARVARTAAGVFMAVATAVSVSGCMTVHGGAAIMPAASEEEAADALAHFVEVSNESNATFDAELNRTIESGPLGEIDYAGLVARGTVDPEGNPDFEPLELSDTRFLIPQQAGWPKFFVADTATNRSGENRWLLVFTRDGIDEDWAAVYLSVLDPSLMPEFAVDEDGYAEDIPVPVVDAGDTDATEDADEAEEADEAGGADDAAAWDDSGLVMPPGQLSSAYNDFLASKAGPFTDGTYTTEAVERREESNSNPAYAMQYQDSVPTEPGFEPVALRATDGSALVFFSTRHHEKQTMAEGETPVVDPLVEVLMEGTAETSVTLVRVAMHAALVPAAGEGDIAVPSRVTGVTSAVGE